MGINLKDCSHVYLLSLFDVTTVEFGMQGGNVCTADIVLLQISVYCHFTMIPIQEARHLR